MRPHPPSFPLNCATGSGCASTNGQDCSDRSKPQAAGPLYNSAAMANTQFIADLVSRVDQLLLRYTELQHTNEQLSAQVATLQAERDLLRTQHEELGTRHAELNARVCDLGTRDAAFTAQVADLESQLATLSTEHDLLRSRHAAARARIDALLDRLHKANAIPATSPLND